MERAGPRRPRAGGRPARLVGVTRSLGYQPDGWSIRARKGRPVRLLRFRIDRDGWLASRRHTVTIEGLEACLPMFGLGAGLEPLPDAVEPMT